MPKPKAKPTPVISVTSPWGEVEGNAPPQGRHATDRFYVHGYSDKRQDNEQERAKGHRPAPLPFRFQWVTVERSSGAPTNEKVSDFKGRGYTVMQYDEAETYGIDVNKSSFIKGPDGTCRQGSQMLMVAPKEAAARDYRLQMERNEALQGAISGRLQDAAKEFNAEHKLSPQGGTSYDYDERTDGSPFEFEEKLSKSKK